MSFAVLVLLRLSCTGESPREQSPREHWSLETLGFMLSKALARPRLANCAGWYAAAVLLNPGETCALTHLQKKKNDKSFQQ